MEIVGIRPQGGWIGHSLGRVEGTTLGFTAASVSIQPPKTLWDYPKHVIQLLEADDDWIRENYHTALRLATGEVIRGPSIGRVDRLEGRPRINLYCHQLLIEAPININTLILFYRDGELVKESIYPWTPGMLPARLLIAMTHGFDQQRSNAS